MEISAVHETALYGADLGALRRFYADVLGLRVVSTVGEVGIALRLPDGGVLLLFDPDLAAESDRHVPPHGAHGPGHVAFLVPVGSLAGWRGRLAAHGVGIESEIAWPRGGVSLYVRDPAGNSVELVDGEIWPDRRDAA